MQVCKLKGKTFNLLIKAKKRARTKVIRIENDEKEKKRLGKKSRKSGSASRRIRS